MTSKPKRCASRKAPRRRKSRHGDGRSIILQVEGSVTNWHHAFLREKLRQPVGSPDAVPQGSHLCTERGRTSTAGSCCCCCCPSFSFVPFIALSDGVSSLAVIVLCEFDGLRNSPARSFTPVQAVSSSPLLLLL